MEVQPPHSLHCFLANGANFWVETGWHLVGGEGLLKRAEFEETAAVPHIQAVTGILEQETGSLSPTINLTLLMVSVSYPLL